MFVFQLRLEEKEKTPTVLYTIDQVKKLVGHDCPDTVAMAILKSDNVEDKIKKVRKAFSDIDKAFRENSDDAGYEDGKPYLFQGKYIIPNPMYDFFDNQKFTNNFVEDPAKTADSFVSIFKSGALFLTFLFSHLNDQLTDQFIVKHLDLFAKIATAAKTETYMVLPLFSNQVLFNAFVNDPEKITNALVEVAKYIDKNGFYDTGFGFKSNWEMANDEFFIQAFVKDPERFAEIIRHAKKTDISPILFFGNPIISDLFCKNPASFDLSKGMKLAKKLGTKTDYETLLNLGWAAREIGEEKAIELHNTLGLTYFMRYTKATLEALSCNIHEQKSDKPVLLATMNKYDHNGASYIEAQELEKLTKYYKLIIVETDSEKGFYDSLKSVSKKYGPIDTLVIGGHGSPEKIMLGSMTDKGMLDLTDRNELENVKDCFAKSPKCILISCATGRESEKGVISQLLSDVWDASLYAPVAIFSRSDINVDIYGEVTGVDYFAGEYKKNEKPVETKEFFKGVPKKL